MNSPLPLEHEGHNWHENGFFNLRHHLHMKYEDHSQDDFLWTMDNVLREVDQRIAELEAQVQELSIYQGTDERDARIAELEQQVQHLEVYPDILKQTIKGLEIDKRTLTDERDELGRRIAEIEWKGE